MQDGPHLVSPLGSFTMIVMHLRQRAISPFDSRRGTRYRILGYNLRQFETADKISRALTLDTLEP